jgi:hypothetical protein
VILESAGYDVITASSGRRFTWSATRGGRRMNGPFASEWTNASTRSRACSWYGPEHVFFKVRADDGRLYILRHEPSVPDGEWKLVSFREFGARR